MPRDAKHARTHLAALDLAGHARTAVVVGGTTGIGAAIARALARRGCARIVISGRSRAKAEDTMRRVRDARAGVQVEFVASDVM
jgi:NAD(P)-dependent dehydrogenase (short-subunit alcohol dehydrogenase family)